MEGLERRVRETVEQYHMLDSGDRVVAAVSGGADSVCLLALLCTFREPWGVRIRALHVHHGLRGEEADRDADFVRSLCEGFHVPCHILKVDVRGFAAEKGMSEEEAGRFLRYEALEREAADWEDEDRTGPDGGSADSSVRPVKIAVAHHSGDQVETILHNLFRGSGLSGMKGIVYRRGRIIRPLLDVDRDCILKWLADHGLSYVQDSTNDTLHYTRNRIRNQLLPEIEQYVNRGAAGNILRLGHLAAQADEYLENQAAAWIK
ncbi:tRNA lysidine(34) synthetase TilS, partial [Enterocloster clostridioformis]